MPLTAMRLAVHAGAGAIPSAASDPDFAPAARQALEAALTAGWAVLAGAGSAVEACTAAVCLLEDCELFNAGRGSVLTRDGCVEMDAAVMDGARQRSGAVIGLRRVVHPVEAARAVMEHSPHAALAGDGAESFARERGLACAEPEFFVTPARRAQLERFLSRARSAAPQSGEPGTVGAVARDAEGHLAAATSTGGMTGKWPGRVSDSALIGAGTWADDASCAVSATGHGELFIRSAFAHEVDALLRHAGLPLATACQGALARIVEAGGEGGCIALDAQGQLALPFHAPAMPRGWIDADAGTRVAVDPGDPLPLP